MYLGHGAYGIEAASRLYFNKSNKQLYARGSGAHRRHLPDARAAEPVRRHEARDSAAATSCCSGMADERYITQAQADAAKAEADRHARPAEPAARASRRSSSRRCASISSASTARRCSTRAASSVTDDARCAAAGDRQPRARARAAALRQAPRLAASRDAQRPRREAHDRGLQGRPLEPPDRGRATSCPAVVGHRAEDRRRASAHRPLSMRISTSEGFAWTRADAPRTCSSRAISSTSAITKIDEATRHRDGDARADAARRGRASSRSTNRTGQIKAMVGGWSFNRSKFNRAVQAYRQLGSTFKPIVYTAAIDRGFTPTSILIDAPVSYPSGNGQIYSPHNYDHKFEGPITLRWALEESRNIPAIKMMDTLGPKNVARLRQAVRLRGGLPAVSADRARRRRRDAARSDERVPAFPNQGVRMKPFAVVGGEGSRRQPARGEPRRAERRHPRRHRAS